jgi:hypothetical protein
MARGWESKSVESQIEDARSGSAPRDGLTAAERDRLQKREGLELSRVRIVRELGEATSPLRRVALENALVFLDDEISKLR